MRQTAVKFSNLVIPDDINARAKTKDGLGELAASIAAKGLIQPLAVRQTEDHKFAVIDGRRRYLAIERLVKSKKHPEWTDDIKVPTIVRVESDADALETSLAANIVRLPMHPVDQFEVFARLESEGRTPADIAGRFGITKKTVTQMLALGNLAPVVRKAWRADEIDAETARAFTLDDRHEVQTALFKRLRKENRYMSPYIIRSELAGDKVSSNQVADDLLAAYKAAGGTIAQDLFSDEQRLEDPALLAKCRDEWVEKETERLKADGWGWVGTKLPSDWWVPYQEADLNQKEKKRIADLERRMDEEEGLRPDDYDAIEDEIQAIEDKARARGYSKAFKAERGALIHADGFNPRAEFGACPNPTSKAGKAKAAGVAGVVSRDPRVGGDTDAGEKRPVFGLARATPHADRGAHDRRL